MIRVTQMTGFHGPSVSENPAAQRVLLVDDHQMFVQLLSTALSAEPDLECVGAAHDTTSALQRARDLHPDLIVMDVRLGDGDGIAAAEQLGRELPATRVVILTAYADAGLVRRAVDAGAAALLAKDGELGVLLAALRAARGDSFVLGPGIQSAPTQCESRLAAVGLFPTAGQMLRLLAAGLSVDEVARELDMDPRTARRRVADLVAGLGVETPAQAVSVAVHRGLIRIGDD